MPAGQDPRKYLPRDARFKASHLKFDGGVRRYTRVLVIVMGGASHNIPLCYAPRLSGLDIIRGGNTPPEGEKGGERDAR